MNYISLIFLKHLNPAEDLLPSGDKVSELLHQIWEKKSSDDDFEEASEIAFLLEETDPEKYRGHPVFLSHSFSPETWRKDKLLNRATSESILAELWTWIAECPNLPIASNLEHELRRRRELVDNDGRTILHLVAGCRHRHETETDMLAKMAEMLICLGFDPTASTKSGATPLHLAVHAKNLGVIQVLLDNGAEPDQQLITWSACRYEYKILKILLPFLKLRSQNKHTDEFDIHNVLHTAVGVPLAERKLRHGDNYARVGLETVKYVSEIIADNGGQTNELKESLLRTIVIAGNDDFFPLFSDNLNPEAYTQLLPVVIDAHQRDMFLCLLDHGVDANHPFKSGKYKGKHPLVLCAAEVGLDSFFFDTLITRNTIPAACTRDVAERLTRNSMAGDALSKFLDLYPDILRYDKTNAENDLLLTYAVAFGFPQTVEPIISKGGYLECIQADGGGALIIAAALTRPECFENLKILLSYERNVSDPGKQVRLGMALVAACQWGNIHAIKELLNVDANPNFQNDQSLSVEDHSPFVAAHFRRMMYQDNTDSTMLIQTRFEEAKFRVVHRMLKEKGLDETCRFGPNKETAEEYCQRIMKTYRSALLIDANYRHHYNRETLKKGGLEELEEALQNLQGIFGDYIQRTPDGGAMWVGPDLFNQEHESD